jgi:hypothetical protein
MAVARGLDINHPITIPEFIRRFGCMSNPQAREYLNADAIKELQQLVDDPLIVPTARLCFEKAITLIRDGVKTE